MVFRPNRRTFLAGAGAAFAAGGLLPRHALSQDVRLRLQWWGSQPRAERTFEVANMFMEANPDIAVSGETIGWADYWTRLATQVAGRNAPDVMQMDYRYITEYARRGALAPLDDFRDGVMGLEGFGDEALAGGMVDGKLYGISLGANSSAMMINRAAFEAAGLDIPAPGTTWRRSRRSRSRSARPVTCPTGWRMRAATSRRWRTGFASRARNSTPKRGISPSRSRT